MIGQCECGELFGGMGLTITEICPSCGTAVEMEDPGDEWRPYSIQILNNESLEVVQSYETWEFSADEDLLPGKKYPVITLRFPVDQEVEEEENGG